MSQVAKSAAVLGGLCVLLMVAAVWGFNALTAPFPGRTKPPDCVDTAVAAGEKVFPPQVTVSVYNAGTRTGLASRTMGLLTDEGFDRGTTGDAPKDVDVAVAAIWTKDPDSPAVALLTSRLGRDTKIVKRAPRGPGITVVVGDRFRRLARGVRSVTAEDDATICSPPPLG